MSTFSPRADPRGQQMFSRHCCTATRSPIKNPVTPPRPELSWPSSVPSPSYLTLSSAVLKSGKYEHHKHSAPYPSGKTQATYPTPGNRRRHLHLCVADASGALCNRPDHSFLLQLPEYQQSLIPNL